MRRLFETIAATQREMQEQFPDLPTDTEGEKRLKESARASYFPLIEQLQSAFVEAEQQVAELRKLVMTFYKTEKHHRLPS